MSESAGLPFPIPSMPLALRAAAVDADLGEAALLTLQRDDPLGRLEALEGTRRHVVGGVDLTALERGDHRVGVVEEAEDDLVDRAACRPSSSSFAFIDQN